MKVLRKPLSAFAFFCIALQVVEKERVFIVAKKTPV